MRIPVKQQKTRKRRGAVAVEFAFIAPVLLSIVLGMIELTRAYDAQNLLQTAAREGARFAAMDRTDMLDEGVSANSKLIEDVTNFLITSGIPADSIDVSVVDAEDPCTEFDLDDPENDLRLFEVRIEVPFSAVSYTPVSEAYDYALTASITFRNGRATLSE